MAKALVLYDNGVADAKVTLHFRCPLDIRQEKSHSLVECRGEDAAIYRSFARNA